MPGGNIYGPYLEADAFREIIRPAMVRSGDTTASLSRRSGVSVRAIRRLLNGHTKRIRLDIADKLCIALNIVL